MLDTRVSGRRWPRCLVLALGLVACWSSCNPYSLDYLKNGHRLDGSSADDAAGPYDDVPLSPPDARADASGEAKPIADASTADGRSDGATAIDGPGLPNEPDLGEPADTGGTPGTGAGGQDGGETEAGPGAGGEPGSGGVAGDSGSGGMSAAGGAGMGGQSGDGGAGGAPATGGAGGGAGGTTQIEGTGGTAPDASPDLADDGVDVPVDAVADAADLAVPRCRGVDDSGICWYLGRSGDSCAATCAFHGGSSPQAASHVGVAAQGGSVSECSRLFTLLGSPGNVFSGTRSDTNGLGCMTALNLRVWLSSPPYSDTASLAGAQLVCGCLR